MSEPTPRMNAVECPRCYKIVTESCGPNCAWKWVEAEEKELIPKTDADLHRLEEMAERRYAAGDNDSHAILTMAIALIAKHERMNELRARRDRLAKMISLYLDTPVTVKQSIKLEQALRDEISKP